MIFLQNNDRKIPVAVIVGPTASGKTALAVALARHYDAEILSFDSMQLYKGMDIATAKPTAAEMCGVPHHMISEVENTEAFSVARYKECADKIIRDIEKRKKRVIMVGGTGLYADTVLKNIELLPSGDTSLVRRELKDELAALGAEEMHRRLCEIDPETAEKLHVNNTGRVLRALEVYRATGHTMSYQVENSTKSPSPYRPLYIGLTARDRQVLYDRIDQRVDKMLEQGLLAEAEEFLKSSSAPTAKQAIGFKELAPFINGEMPLSECVLNLKRETRRYAKRQLTWFRKNPDINWLYIDEADKNTEDENSLLRQAVGIIDGAQLFEEE